MSKYKGDAVDPSKQLESVWDHILRHRVGVSGVHWPSTAAVLGDVTTSDYNTLFSRTEDVAPSDEGGGENEGTRATKILCPAGALCKVRVEWFHPPPGAAPGADAHSGGYTGLFAPGEADHGLLRLSTALASMARAGSGAGGGAGSALTWALSWAQGGGGEDEGSGGEQQQHHHHPWESQLFPCAALKVFRRGRPSGNLLFGGKKTGQVEKAFFAHALCTHLTEKVPLYLQWLLAVFRRYSEHPTQLGLSDFASVESETEAGGKVASNFPWCLALHPTKEAVSVAAAAVESSGAGGADTSETDDQAAAFLHQLLAIPAGTPLFDVFALPAPPPVPAPPSKAKHKHKPSGGGSVWSWLTPAPDSTDEEEDGDGDGEKATAKGAMASTAAPGDLQAQRHPAGLQRIGRVVSTSEFVCSASGAAAGGRGSRSGTNTRSDDISGSDSVFFRHQRKEDDYALRPAWLQLIEEHRQCKQETPAAYSRSKGQAQGVVGAGSAVLLPSEIGSDYIEGLVRGGLFQDWEAEA